MSENGIKEAYRAGYEFGLAQAQKQKPQPQVAYWIAKKIDYRHYHYLCSNCGYRSRYNKGNFCSDCGFKMEEKE